MTSATLLEPTAAWDDGRLLSALRRGDERAFVELVERHYPAMLRVARISAGDDAAEAIVAEAWRSALQAIDEIADGTSVKTSLMRIVIAEANRTARLPDRTEPVRRIASSDGRAVAVIRRAIAELPLRQQIVISLRDIEGWTAHDVCETLGITPQCQRQLLNRARQRVHRALLTRTGGSSSRHPEPALRTSG